ncbi:MAG: hypothetical protein KF744_01950 [Taibaiella sp.]|nr:hypothetical protein [Taibaiella sp.]
MQFTASGRHNRTFEIKGATGDVLATLDYPTWHAPRRAIITYGGTAWETVIRGFFRKGMDIKSGDQVIGSMRFAGFGRMKIEFADGRQYTFKRVGFLNGYMALITDSSQEIVKIRQVNRWAFFRFTFNIETDDNYREANDPALLLLLIFCINYLRAIAYTS